jgi:hypothetical protein
MPNRCVVRVLIVADGRIHFKHTGTGFSLTEVVEKALRTGTRLFEVFKITTARRLNPNKSCDFDPDQDNCPDIPNFTFHKEVFGIDKYDQVWLFGDAAEGTNENEEPPLTQSELEVLARFMNEGGGVFATGDHMSLGYAMCGSVPRVRSMRRWCYFKCGQDDLKAPGIGDTRIDTLREGSDSGFEMSDQSDSVPQEIRPKYFPEPGGNGAHPHPLLVKEKRAVTVLPDHAHEGECVVPTDLGKRITYGEYSFDEYPRFGQAQLPFPPQVVAFSTSAGSIVGEQVNAFPTEPRSYYPIVAYNGHQVSIEGKAVGRVVVDSSFHHFLDINLRGQSAGAKRGFYDLNNNPTADYQAFKEYYRNIVRYLCPPSLRSTYYRALLVDLRSQSPTLGDLTPTAKPTFQEYLDAGALTAAALTESYSRAEALQCALALMPEMPEVLRQPIAGLIDPWLPDRVALVLQAKNPAEFEASNTKLNFDVVVRLILGTAIIGLIKAQSLTVNAILTSFDLSTATMKTLEGLAPTSAGEMGPVAPETV